MLRETLVIWLITAFGTLRQFPGLEIFIFSRPLAWAIGSMLAYAFWFGLAALMNWLILCRHRNLGITVFQGSFVLCEILKGSIRFFVLLPTQGYHKLRLDVQPNPNPIELHCSD